MVPVCVLCGSKNKKACRISMLLVDIYRYLILFIVGIWTYQLSQQYRLRTFSVQDINAPSPQFGIIVLAVFLTLLIGLRPMDDRHAWMWVDSWHYRQLYNHYLSIGNSFVFNPLAENFLWDNLFVFWAINDWGLTNLFLISDAIYFGCTYLACRKWFPHDTVIAYLAFLGAFSTYSYSYNGVKAGVAAALFLLALANYEKKVFSIVLVLLSWGCHHSMIILVAAYILTMFFKNPKWYFYGWALCVLMATLHISFFVNLFAGMTSDERAVRYLTGAGDNAYMTGFRPDFILYSAAPILVGYIIFMRNRIEISNLYRVLLCMYLCTNGIWCLCMYAASTNRIAYLSWFMYPFVLIYPFLKEDLSGLSLLGTRNQYVMLAIVVMYHFLFTFFMEVIYY